MTENYAELLDVSVPIRPTMPIYPDDPAVYLERVFTMERDGANGSRLNFGVHTGTHVDAPIHFIDGAPAADALDLSVLIGPSLVVDARSVENALTADVLRTLDVPADCERLLFRTSNSELWARDDFDNDYVSFTGDGAAYLVDLGVRLVGIDYLSIGDDDAHRCLLGAGVVVVEGLDLRAAEPGAYTLACLPLNIVGSDGAPARAVLMR